MTDPGPLCPADKWEAGNEESWQPGGAAHRSEGSGRNDSRAHIALSHVPRQRENDRAHKTRKCDGVEMTDVGGGQQVRL